MKKIYEITTEGDCEGRSIRTIAIEYGEAAQLKAKYNMQKEYTLDVKEFNITGIHELIRDAKKEARQELAEKDVKPLENIDEIVNSIETNGKKLAEKVEEYLASRNDSGYSVNEEAVWEVHGEDPSPDWPQGKPFLGYFKGKFGDVLTVATATKHFYTWGRGGDIKKYQEEEKTIFEVPEGLYNQQPLQHKYEQAQRELEKARKKIAELEERM